MTRRYRITVDFQAGDDAAARVVHDVVQRKLTQGAVRLQDFQTELLAEAAPNWKLVEVLERRS